MLVHGPSNPMPDRDKVVAHLQTFVRHLDPFSVRVEKSDLTADDLVSRGVSFYRNAV